MRVVIRVYWGKRGRNRRRRRRGRIKIKRRCSIANRGGTWRPSRGLIALRNSSSKTWHCSAWCRRLWGIKCGLRRTNAKRLPVHWFILCYSRLVKWPLLVKKHRVTLRQRVSLQWEICCGLRQQHGRNRGFGSSSK